jgi:hypothetical protein
MIIKHKSSIQTEEDRFFKELSNEDFNICAVTKSAFTKARAKLNPLAFKRLNEGAVNAFYDKAPYSTWHNRRVLATDGTRLTLTNHPSILAEFGSHKFGSKADSERTLKINRTNSIATTQDIILGVLLKKLVVKGLKAFDDIVFRTREIIRPQRSNDRKHRPKKRYYMNYKPL